MNIEIKNKQIVIENTILEYNPYYFAIWNKNIDYRITVKNVLEQWASALEALKESEFVYLPYNLEDQLSGFIKASLYGEDIVLRDVLASVSGYDMDLDNLTKYIYMKLKLKEILIDDFGSAHKVIPKFDLRFDKKEFIDSLRKAEITRSNK